MNTVIGNLRGNVINVVINDKIISKRFATQDEADDVYRLIANVMGLDVIKDVDIEEIYSALDVKIQVTKSIDDFIYDSSNNCYYLEGFDTPVPIDLVNTIERYREKDFPVDAIKNFWTRLMANPDKRVRTDLFKFTQTYDFSITKKGYLVVYKTVDYMEKMENDLAEFVSENYLRIKFRRKQAPAKYAVYAEYKTILETEMEYQDSDDGYYDLEGWGSYEEFVEEEGYEPEYIYEEEEVEVEVEKRVLHGYGITEKKVFDKWDEDPEKDFEYIGQLNELQAKVDRIEDQSTYTDMYSHSMKIKLGIPVKQERPDCNGNPTIECSHGLHVGATKYVERFRGYNNTEAPVLLCLVDPMNVVAVPEYDNSKIRVCEYYPYAKATVSPEGKIDIIEQQYFEDDYTAINDSELQKLIMAVKDEEREIRKQAMSTESDGRSLEEYSKILQARVTNIS